jgi:hypothetical protein
MATFHDMRTYKRFLLLLTLSYTLALSASFGIKKDGKLDQPAITKAYKDSDWDEVRSTLEGYLHRNGDAKVSLDERIFAYKYLGVIFAADSVTRTRAESYFNRLFDLSPTVEIMDMYASKKISDFFREVKRDYQDHKVYANKYDTYGHETKPSAKDNAPETTAFTPTPNDSMPILGNNTHRPQPVPKRTGTEMTGKNGTGWIWWTAGVVAVPGVGTGVFYLTQEKAPNRQVNVTDVTPPEPVR